MRLSTSSSVILATLASSVSFGQLAAAAPTDDPVNGVALNGFPGLGSGNPLGDATVRRSAGAHQRRELPPALEDPEYGLDGLPKLGAKRNLEARQLGAVTDTVAGLLPGVVDKILGLLGLQRTSAISTAEALPKDVEKQLEVLVGQVTGAAGGLPVVGGAVGGVAGSVGGVVGSVTGREDSGTSAPPPSPSSPAPGPPAAPAPPSLPISGLPVALPTGMLPVPVPAPSLPVPLPSNPVASALPVSVPVLFGPPSNATA